MEILSLIKNPCFPAQFCGNDQIVTGTFCFSVLKQKIHKLQHFCISEKFLMFIGKYSEFRLFLCLDLFFFF